MYLRLRDMREDYDKTQAQVAEILGCTQQAYSRYENGRAQMSCEMLCRLADYFGTSVAYPTGPPDDKLPHPPSKRKP